MFAPELDAYFEDPASQLFADDSDQDDEMDHQGPHGHGHVQALFVDTSSPRRSPMPGTASANSSGFSYANSQGHSRAAAAAAGTSGLQDPFTAYFPAPLMTSTASL